jgi:hypothetical protein
MMDERQEGRKDGKRSRFGKKYLEHSVPCLYHIKSKMISKSFSIFIISLLEYNSRAINNKV